MNSFSENPYLSHDHGADISMINVATLILYNPMFSP